VARLWSGRCRTCRARFYETTGACSDCGDLTRLTGGACKACRLFRWGHPPGSCPYCGHQQPIGAAGACWSCQATHRAARALKQQRRKRRTWPALSPAAQHVKLTVRKVSKYWAQATTPDQPDIWTTLDFEADEAEAGDLAQAFADALDQPGWYVNFESPAESFVVFPGRIFRYPRGDQAGRAEAQACGRQLAIPEPQLDWTV